MTLKPQRAQQTEEVGRAGRHRKQEEEIETAGGTADTRKGLINNKNIYRQEVDPGEHRNRRKAQQTEDEAV